MTINPPIKPHIVTINTALHSTYKSDSKMAKPPQRCTPQSVSERIMLATPPVIDPNVHSKQAIVMAWHLSLNQAPAERLKDITKSALYPSLTIDVAEMFAIMTCSSCYSAKLKPVPHKRVKFTPRAPGDCISSDTIGPISPVSAMWTQASSHIPLAIHAICDLHSHS